MKDIFKVYDWTGVELTFYGSFPTFEDAWSAIYERFPEEECFDDFYVFKV